MRAFTLLASIALVGSFLATSAAAEADWDNFDAKYSISEDFYADDDADYALGIPMKFNPYKRYGVSKMGRWPKRSYDDDEYDDEEYSVEDAFDFDEDFAVAPKAKGAGQKCACAKTIKKGAKKGAKKAKPAAKHSYDDDEFDDEDFAAGQKAITVIVQHPKHGKMVKEVHGTHTILHHPTKGKLVKPAKGHKLERHPIHGLVVVKKTSRASYDDDEYDFDE
ncbi:hypothetical protein BC828DRAFT_439055 [Blastocladiella britannica]|nr:hypothetical protein BC828DRAFT_439055 [Blastocladiella britannica]